MINKIRMRRYTGKATDKQMIAGLRALFMMMCILFMSVTPAYAQTVIEEDEEEMEEEVAAEDEVTVTDEDGNEEVIDFPEAMTYDLDSLMNLYMSKKYLSQDDDCHTTDENPTFDKDVYLERLKRIPSVMELPYNEVVQKFIERYSGRLRYSVSYMLGACNF